MRRTKLTSFVIMLMLVVTILPNVLAETSCATNEVALLGDSLTVGWGKEFIKACGNEPINYAIEGATTGEMLAKVNSISPTVRTLIVLGGTNDINNDVGTIEITNNLGAIYLAVRENGVERVVAITIPPFNKKDMPEKNFVVGAVNEWIRNQEGYSVDQVIDFYSLLVGVAPCMHPTYGGSCDNVHPNAKGYQAMSDKVLNEVFGYSIAPSQIPILPPSVPSGYEAAEPELAVSQKVPKNLPQRWKEIDETWIRVGPYVGGIGNGFVWDNSLGDWNWRNFEEVYFTLTYAPAPTAVGKVYKPSPGGNEYNELIQQAAQALEIEAPLIKALMKYESQFNPTATSEGNCKGLMQVCSGSWDGCFNSLSTQYSLKNDPYDPKSSIFVGTCVLKSKLAGVSGCGINAESEDRVKCVIAAYNAGEGLINSAAKDVGAPATWSAVNQKLQDENFVKQNPKYNTPWFNAEVCKGHPGVTRRACKFMKINSYVNSVYNMYLSYKTYGLSGTGTSASVSK
ncbi:transglycosylase SLT domain-containing protein [Candidatus Woesearchaeota archaeon]|nr:transglycosylase SLT domain-containing protein [Candidatus Woesearchaeota archaeon]